MPPMDIKKTFDATKKISIELDNNLVNSKTSNDNFAGNGRIKV